MYTGVTNNIARRVYEHKNGVVDGFTKRYQVHKPVYAESCSEVTDAIAREKQLKKWSRVIKNQLVESVNPDWHEIGA